MTVIRYHCYKNIFHLINTVMYIKWFEFNSTCIKYYPKHLQFHVTSSHIFKVQRERETREQTTFSILASQGFSVHFVYGEQDFKIHKICFLRFYADINSSLLIRNQQYLKDGFFVRNIWNFCFLIYKKSRKIFLKGG